jgi:hypothetical protein
MAALSCRPQAKINLRHERIVRTVPDGPIHTCMNHFEAVAWCLATDLGRNLETESASGVRRSQRACAVSGPAPPGGTPGPPGQLAARPVPRMECRWPARSFSIAPLVDRLLASKGSRRRSRTFPMRLAHLNTAGHRAWRVRRATPRTSMSRGSWPGHRDPGRRVDGRTNRQGPVRVAGSEKAAAHRLGLSHSTVRHHLANARSKVGATTTAQLVWILGPRLLEPDGVAQPEE